VLADGPGTGKLSLVKTGASTQLLSGTNTYTGNTTVTGGTLTLSSSGSLKFVIGASGVNNGIGGTGTVNLNGAFNFDLTGAGTNVGNSWTIVNIGTLTTTFGAAFAVAGFVPAGGGLWTTTNNGARYQFSPATGALTVVPVSHPVISSVQYTGSKLILSGTNGPASGGYSVRSSTNVTLAVTNWPVLTTGTFGPLGQFSVTNPVNPTEPQRFYLLSQP
jgi:autotransporter-associated beta strand protein